MPLCPRVLPRSEIQGPLIHLSQAVEFFQRALNIQQDNGEVWSALGHCYLMQDDLQKAYAAYQQALYLLPNPKVCSHPLSYPFISFITMF
jgi:tetratricopeptide (TPR) repeat protein